MITLTTFTLVFGSASFFGFYYFVDEKRFSPLSLLFSVFVGVLGGGVIGYAVCEKLHNSIYVNKGDIVVDSKQYLIPITTIDNCIVYVTKYAKEDGNLYMMYVNRKYILNNKIYKEGMVTEKEGVERGIIEKYHVKYKQTNLFVPKFISDNLKEERLIVPIGGIKKGKIVKEKIEVKYKFIPEELNTS